MPTRVALGTTCLTSSIWRSSSSSSDTPVTLVSEASQLLTSCAASGSVTAAKTTGMDLVLATTAWAEGAAMATTTSGLSPTNLRSICPAVAVLPGAARYCHFRLSPTVYPASSSAPRPPARTEAGAGCLTIAVAATDSVSATALENGDAKAMARAPSD